MLTWLLVAGFASTPTLDACDIRGSVALGTRLAADLRTTYTVAGTDLRVCVDKAVYPRAAGHGHRLLACYQVGIGAHTNRFCGTGNSFIVWRGFRITVSLRKPRYTGSSDVWLLVERAPATTT